MEAEGVDLQEVSWSRDLLRLNGSGPVVRAVSRLGLAHTACEELASGSLDEVLAAARELDLGGKPFRIRARGLGVDIDTRAVEGAFGGVLGRTGRVNLVQPEMDFRVLADPEFHLGRIVHRVDRGGLESRKVTHRSFSLPISLHPKFCRALVNLARAPAGGTVADPFCGTGGILLEASRLGMRALGGDVRRAMVLGARRSLRDLGVSPEYVVADAGAAPWKAGRVDAVATDPPYGRAASTRREAPGQLYDRAFRAMADALSPGRYVAAVLPSEEAVASACAHLELVERHALRVHKSLTRTFCAFLRR